MYPAGNETKIEFKMNETETERAKNSENRRKKKLRKNVPDFSVR